nr:MAG TPA: hypothetical protein [Caudoviricetes sp.]
MCFSKIEEESISRYFHSIIISHFIVTFNDI